MTSSFVVFSIFMLLCYNTTTGLHHQAKHRIYSPRTAAGLPIIHIARKQIRLLISVQKVQKKNVQLINKTPEHLGQCNARPYSTQHARKHTGLLCTTRDQTCNCGEKVTTRGRRHTFTKIHISSGPAGVTAGQ